MEGNNMMREKRKQPEDCTTGGGESSNSDGECRINVELKYEDKSITVKASPNDTVSDMRDVINSNFDLSPSTQKLLINRGMVLKDDMTLMRSLVELQDTKNTIQIRIFLRPTDQEEVNDGESRRLDALAESGNIEIVDIAITKKWYYHWRVTGMVGLSALYIKAIPEEVWNCGRRATVLGISTNKIEKIPAEVGGLTSLKILLLNKNQLLSDKISWEAFTKLRSLTIIDLSDNKLEVLPPALGALTSLRKLYVSRNLLTDIPTEIGLLSQLELLKLDNNRMSKIPASIGDCTCLTKVCLSSNLIVELPETICHLKNLKVLLLSKNSLMNSLPSTILETCSMLRRLDIDDTGIKIDTLHSFKGWADFDRRRRS